MKKVWQLMVGLFMILLAIYMATLEFLPGDTSDFVILLLSVLFLIFMMSGLFLIIKSIKSKSKNH